MGGRGHVFLRYSFDILTRQTFKDFEVIVSDHSKDGAIEALCKEYQDRLDIHYYRTKVVGSSYNTNNAIRKAGGKLIKILFEDDFLYSDTSLEEIVEAFDLEKDKWLVTACEHYDDAKGIFFKPFYPVYNHDIHLGENTISAPTVLTIKNEDPVFFDEKLMWFMDCDYYKRCYEKFGEPKILNKINAVNRIGKHQIINWAANKKVRSEEHIYLLEKYGEEKLLRKYHRKMKRRQLVQTVYKLTPRFVKETIKSFYYPIRDFRKTREKIK